MSQRSIAVNGDLGSGKSTVARAVAARLGMPRLSFGDLHRQIAQERGISALDLNLRAEVDEEVDRYVDNRQREIAASGQVFVIDSRLAWFFFTDAFKVYLVTDPDTAARRVISRPVSEVEQYSTLAQAREALLRRSESERQRFLEKYHADKTRMRNYDMVIDTTRIPAEAVADRIIQAYHSNIPVANVLLDPQRIYPSAAIHHLRGLWDDDSAFVVGVGRHGPDAIDPISIAYTGRQFYVLDGHRRLSAALQNGVDLVAAVLAAEFDESAVDGLSAIEYFESEVTLGKVYDWDAAHGLELPLPSHLERQIRESLAQQDGR